MARTKYTKRTVVVRPKKRWQMSIYNMPMDDTSLDEYHKTHIDVARTTSGVLVHRITQNALASATPTPAVVKTGNVQCKLFINAVPAEGSLNKLQYMIRCYVVFVPEGVVPTSNWPSQHPEYIMTKGLKCVQNYWRVQVGEAGATPMINQTALVNMQFSSRLKRNLNTGDALYFMMVVEPIEVACTYRVQGEIQYFACYN